MQLSRVWVASSFALLGFSSALLACSPTDDEGGGDNSSGGASATGGSATAGGGAATGGGATATGGSGSSATGGATATGGGATATGGAGGGANGGGGPLTPCEAVNGSVGCCDGSVAKYCDDAGTVHDVPCSGQCGWYEDGYYFCDGEGMDPSGTHAMTCP